MKKLLITIIVLAISTSIIIYFVNIRRQNTIRQNAKAQAEAKKEAEAEKANVVTRNIIENMVRKHNAVHNWTDKIKDKERILGIELEKLWIANRPILFIGTIRDISTADNTNYQVRIYGKTKVLIDEIMFQKTGSVDVINDYGVKTILRLTLKCSKKLIDTLVKEKPDVLSDKNIVVAVIANITQIKSVDYLMSNDEMKSGNVGIGNCLDIFFIGSYSSSILNSRPIVTRPAA